MAADKQQLVSVTGKLVHMDPFFTFGRGLTKTIDTVVIHWTAGSSSSGALSTLWKKKFSYHFLVEADGTIIQTKQLNKQAYHAGVSYGPQGKNVNDYSIGISLVHPSGATDIPNDQVNVLPKLIEDINRAVGGTIKFVTSHFDISPGRKQDPWNLDFEKVVNATNIDGISYWQAGMTPFPAGLADCECEKSVNAANGLTWCKATKGNWKTNCVGQGGYTYNLEKRDDYIKKIKDDLGKGNDQTNDSDMVQN